MDYNRIKNHSTFRIGDSLSQSNEVAKISNIKSIESLLTKMANAKLDVLLRPSMDSKVAVRGKILGLAPLSMRPVFNINQISKRGLEVLRTWKTYQIQIIGTSALTTFSSPGKVQGDFLQIELPKEILSINRRDNARTVVSSHKSSFIYLKSHNPKMEVISEVPVFNIFGEVKSFVSIVDISLSGVCVVTGFPALYDALTLKSKDNSAQLVLPMMPKMPVGVEIRWKKSIRETLPGDTNRMRLYKFGLQFLSLSSEHRDLLKAYIHQLNIADAI